MSDSYASNPSASEPSGAVSADRATAHLPARLVRSTQLVVFVDIRQVTGIMDALDHPNRVVNFLDGYYDLCIDHFEGAGGQVIKFLGDAVLAVFSRREGDSDTGCGGRTPRRLPRLRQGQRCIGVGQM